MLHWMFGASSGEFPPDITVRRRQTLSCLRPFTVGTDPDAKTRETSESQILCAIKSLSRLCWVLLWCMGERFRDWSEQGAAENPSGPPGKLPAPMATHRSLFPEHLVPLGVSCAHGPGGEL